MAHGLLAVRAADALARSEAAMASKADLESVRAAYRSHWTDQGQIAAKPCSAGRVVG
jgi:hypothetical protein